MISISDIKSTKPESFENNLEEEVFKILQETNIPFTYVKNDAVHTMEECSAIEEHLSVEIRKTIVLCNRKKTQFYLVVMPSSKAFNAKGFSESVGERLSFASPDRMEKLLGIQSGSATIMSLLNDSKEMVQLFIDKDVADSQWFGCNTGTNTRHLKIATDDLLKKMIPRLNHQATIVTL
jgi:Ala-tRNA(Pro) deacylase